MVWSDNFTATFFVSFVVAVFVPDIERIKHNVRVVVRRERVGTAFPHLFHVLL